MARSSSHDRDKRTPTRPVSELRSLNPTLAAPSLKELKLRTCLSAPFVISSVVAREEESTMKKLLSALTAAVLATSFALPLKAAPVFVPMPEQEQTGPVQQVKNWKHSNWQANRYWGRRYVYRSCGYYGRCYPRQYGYYGNRYYGNGYYGNGYYGNPGYYPYYRRSGVSIYLNF